MFEKYNYQKIIILIAISLKRSVGFSSFHAHNAEQPIH